MDRSRAVFRLGLALALAGIVVACGPKRPPVVTTGGGATGSRSGAQGGPRDMPDESGPDFQLLPGEGTTGEDILAIDTGEGGPLADITFGYNQASLSPEAQSILEKHVLWLQTHRDTKVRVEGHCDERGTVEYNLALGEQRARAAQDYLAQLGVSADRLSTVSYGKERPVDTGNNEAAWAKNRRAHFAVSR